MNALTIEHVPVTDLPPDWQRKLQVASASHVTVRIEEELVTQVASAAPGNLADNPLVGLWRDHDDVKDVAAYVRSLRRSRFAVNKSDNIGGLG
jgi:hypothetical protein